MLNQALIISIKQNISVGIRNANPSLPEDEIKKIVFSNLNTIFKNAKKPSLSAVDQNDLSALMHAIRLKDEYVVEWLLKQSGIFNSVDINYINKNAETAIYLAVGFRDLGDNLESKEEKANIRENNFRVNDANLNKSRRILELLIMHGAEFLPLIKKNDLKNCVFTKASEVGNLQFLKGKLKLLYTWQAKRYTDLYKFRDRQIGADFILNFLPAAIKGGPAIVKLWETEVLGTFKRKVVTSSFKYNWEDSDETYVVKNGILNEYCAAKAIQKGVLPYFSVFKDLLLPAHQIHYLEAALKIQPELNVSLVLNDAINSGENIFGCFLYATYYNSIDVVKLFLITLNVIFTLDRKTALPILPHNKEFVERIRPDSGRIKDLLVAITVINSMEYPYPKDRILANISSLHEDDLNDLNRIIKNHAILPNLNACIADLYEWKNNRVAVSNAQQPPAYQDLSVQQAIPVLNDKPQNEKYNNINASVLENKESNSIKLAQESNLSFFPATSSPVNKTEMIAQCFKIFSTSDDLWENDNEARQVKIKTTINLMKALYGDQVASQVNQILSETSNKLASNRKSI